MFLVTKWGFKISWNSYMNLNKYFSPYKSTQNENGAECWCGDVKTLNLYCF